MSDPVSVSRTLPSGAQIGTLNSNLEDISEAYDGKVRSINDIQPSIVGKVLLDTGVLTINNTQPTNGNIDITNPADIGEHPTKIIFSDEETHGVKYQNDIIYIKNSSGDIYEVETEPVEYAGHVVITADDAGAVSGVGVTLSQGTEVRNGTFNSSGVCTIDTTNYGNFTLTISTFSITQTVNVLAADTTSVSIHIAKANITITPVGDILYSKTVTLSDGQTGTFGSSGESVTFTVYSTGIYSATCEGYSTGSIGVNALDANYNASIYGTVNLTLTIEGAKEDIITIKNADNETITTVSFDTGATSKSVTLTGIPYSDLGNDNRQYTFISGVAKDTTTGTTDYSKNITLTNNLTEVKLKPENALIWYGNTNFIDGGDFKYYSSTFVPRTTTYTYNNGRICMRGPKNNWVSYNFRSPNTINLANYTKIKYSFTYNQYNIQNNSSSYCDLVFMSSMSPYFSWDQPYMEICSNKVLYGDYVKKGEYEIPSNAKSQRYINIWICPNPYETQDGVFLYIDYLVLE